MIERLKSLYKYNNNSYILIRGKKTSYSWLREFILYNNLYTCKKCKGNLNYIFEFVDENLNNRLALMYCNKCFELIYPAGFNGEQLTNIFMEDKAHKLMNHFNLNNSGILILKLILRQLIKNEKI